MGRGAAIVGRAHTPFGKPAGPGAASLIGRVAAEAADHAGVGAGEMQRAGAALTGAFNRRGAAIANDVSIQEYTK